MRPLTAALALFCLAAPVPAGEKETGPIVVDLSPLVGTKDQTLSMSIHFENGTRLKDWRPERTGSALDLKKAADWAEELAEALKQNPLCNVEAVKGEPRLIIRGYKGKGVLEVRCVAVGLPCENQPKVSRLKDDKKEDKKDKK